MLNSVQKSFLKYSGIAAVLLQLIVIISTGQMMGFNWLGPNPISDLGVTEIFCVYSIGLILGAFLLVFFLYYLHRTFLTTRLFNIVFSIGILCEFITGLAPDQAMLQNPFNAISFLHLPAGTILLVAIPVSMLLFTQSESLISNGKRISIILFTVYFILLIPELFLISQHMFYALNEAVSLFIFDVWVIYVSVTASNRNVDIPDTEVKTKQLTKSL